jgi:hypothetical protein
MTTRTTNGGATKASTGSGEVGPGIDRVLQDLLELEKVQPAEIPRLLSALEHARARLARGMASACGHGACELARCTRPAALDGERGGGADPVFIRTCL